MPSDPLPAQDVEMEQAVLGAMILDRSAREAVRDWLPSEAFYRDGHPDVCEAIYRLHDTDRPVDPLTVEDELKLVERLDVIGGRPYLFTLQNACPAYANADYYGQRVLGCYRLRQMASAGRQLWELAHSNPEDVSETVAEAERIVASALEKGTPGTRAVPVGEVGKRVLAAARERAVHKSHVVGLSTGLRELDWLTAGLEPASLYLIAARPSMGKSALAAQIAWHVGKSEGGGPSLLCNLEMSEEQLTLRLASSEARVCLQGYRTAMLEPEEWKRIELATERMQGIPIRLLCASNITPEVVRREARAMNRTCGLRLIVVDYVQLIPPSGPARRQDNRVAELRDIAHGLKAIAEDLSVPVVVLSQLSRKVEDRPNKRPMLSDLYESGFLEAAGDCICFLYRPEWYEAQKQGSSPGEFEQAELIVAKQRQGPIGVVPLVFRGSLARFENAATDDPFADPDDA